MEPVELVLNILFYVILKYMLRIWLGCTFILNVFACIGQTYNYRHFTPENGLAGSNVYVAVQDSKGYMWFGTDEGVSRYD